jgi:L-arabinose isomerase
MYLNQAAHGDREFGSMQTHLGVARKTVAGHVSDPAVVDGVAVWARAACGPAAVRSLTLARFGDNTRAYWRATTGPAIPALTCGSHVPGTDARCPSAEAQP